MSLTPLPPLDPASPTFRADVDAFFRFRMQAFVSEVSALAANLNSIAAGGAYAIPYVLDFSDTSASDPTAGNFRFNNPNQSASTGLFVSLISSGAIEFTSQLDTFDDSSSTVKGTLRLTKFGDPSKFLDFSVYGLTGTGGAVGTSGAAGWRSISIVCIGGSSASPFVHGDSVVLHFQRSGDKGSKGDPGATPQLMVVRDQKASGAAPQGLPAGVWTKRTINTTTYSSITGAFVLSDEVQLPVGTYSIEGSAPAGAGAAHQIRLFNVTDNTLYDVGTSEALGAGQSSVTRSFLRTVLVVTGSAKKFRIDHYANNIVVGGMPANAGSAEVYSEFLITKVA